MNILVAHGGGPTAVINSSLMGVVETVKLSGGANKIFAARFGAEGMLKNDLVDLTNLPSRTIEKLNHTPASAIGSCRRKLNDDDRERILYCLEMNNIDCLLYNGGNDSMDTCQKLAELLRRERLNISVAGIPKTMDNDLAVTDHCPGYGSAAKYAAITAAEMACEAASLPIHVLVLELMGRDVGWVTAASTLAFERACCETLTYLPEKPVDEEKMLQDIERAFSRGRGLLVTVSEGIRGLDGRPLADTGIVDGFGHVMLGGAAQYIANLVMAKTGIKARAEKPGLIGRCSVLHCSYTDREEAYAVGKYACEAALRGETGYMVAINADRKGRYAYELFLTELENVANLEKRFPADWIDKDNRISHKFREYVEPLIGEYQQEYAVL